MPNLPGGTSVICYLKKIRDGAIFTEGFENDNFINAEGWTTLQGVPANTSQQYKDGIKSWDNSANSQSLPVAKKVITNTNVRNWVARVFFYDDSTNTTSQGPYFKIKLADGNYCQIGVRNAVSTTKYCVGLATTEDNFPVILTGSPRSTGWHLFQIISTGNPGQTATYTAQVDSFTGVASSAMVLSTVSEIHVNSNTVGGTGSSFGYFDEVGYYSSTQCLIYHNLTEVNAFRFYNSSNALVDFDSSENPFIFGPLVTTSDNLPLSGYAEFSGSTATNLIFRTALFQVNLGDIFEMVKLDLTRKVELPGYTPTALKQVNQSSSGVVETLITGLKDKLVFSIKELQGFYWVEAIRNWFQDVVDGSQFSLMTDNSFDNAFGVVNGSVSALGTTLTLFANLSTNQTDAFNVNTLANGVYANNYFYVIRDAANTRKQLVTIASKTTTTLTLNETLKFSVATGDFIYSQYFFPFLEIDGNDLSGMTIKDPNIPSYNWVQRCKEYNNG